MNRDELDNRCINTIRFLAVDRLTSPLECA
jgi:hypothetical protein